MSKIGIMGGTFNPIHNGHIKIAQAARSEYHLDKVIFLTSGNPPHKRDRKILDASIRHIMVKRAISGIEGFEACDWEVNAQNIPIRSQLCSILMSFIQMTKFTSLSAAIHSGILINGINRRKY